MIFSTFNIWDDGEYSFPHCFGFVPNIHSYLHNDGTIRPAILIVPGGGYAYCSEQEGEPVARTFYDLGYQTFVLTYTTNLLFLDPLLDQPLKDISRAVRILRSRHEEFQFIPEELIICGFSAGGHLTASLGVFHQDLPEDDKYPGISARPDAMLLCYPVITMGQYAHAGSVTALLGNHPSEEQKDHYSLEKHVSPSTPPAFIFQTAGDGSVPVENSGLFATAMKQAGVPFAYHVFTTGPHGLSIATEDWVNRVHCNPYTLDQVYRMLDHFRKGQFPEADPEYAEEMIAKFEPRRDPSYINTGKQPNREVAVWPVLADQWLRYVRGITPCL